MRENNKLMEMLTGYAAAHQHPFNVAVHMIGIPTIMLGVLIPLSKVSVDIDGFQFTLAQFAVVCMFLFYLTLDVVFATVFLVAGLLIAALAGVLGDLAGVLPWTIAAAAFFGGYLAQFVGHAVEKSAPVILKHPIQANLAAPFFTVVELFSMAGLRKDLFNEVQAGVDARRQNSS